MNEISLISEHWNNLLWFSPCWLRVWAAQRSVSSSWGSCLKTWWWFRVKLYQERWRSTSEEREIVQVWVSEAEPLLAYSGCVGVVMCGGMWAWLWAGHVHCICGLESLPHISKEIIEKYKKLKKTMCYRKIKHILSNVFFFTILNCFANMFLFMIK